LEYKQPNSSSSAAAVDATNLVEIKAWTKKSTKTYTVRQLRQVWFISKAWKVQSKYGGLLLTYTIQNSYNTPANSQSVYDSAVVDEDMEEKVKRLNRQVEEQGEKITDIVCNRLILNSIPETTLSQSAFSNRKNKLFLSRIESKLEPFLYFYMSFLSNPHYSSLNQFPFIYLFSMKYLNSYSEKKDPER
jgi:hypothetical protein